MTLENNIGNSFNDGDGAQVGAIMNHNYLDERVWLNPNAYSNTEAATTAQNCEHVQAREDIVDFEDCASPSLRIFDKDSANMLKNVKEAGFLCVAVICIAICESTAEGVPESLSLNELIYKLKLSETKIKSTCDG